MTYSKRTYTSSSSGAIVTLLVSDTAIDGEHASDGNNRVAGGSAWDAREALESREAGIFCASSITRLLAKIDDRMTTACLSY
jgi:hypothetical protein